MGWTDVERTTLDSSKIEKGHKEGVVKIQGVEERYKNKDESSSVMSFPFFLLIVLTSHLFVIMA